MTSKIALVEDQMHAVHFAPASLRALALSKKAEYARADPFPHAVLDNFLPTWLLERIVGEFPTRHADGWVQFDGAQERKLASTHESSFGPATQQLLINLNSAAFCEFLGELTGIPGLIPDPYFVGGGMHQIERGGFLKIHADFNRHQRLGLDRRLNLLLYLNDDWEESYGGHLELWKTDMSACAKRLLPSFNRCVIFSTTSDSFHGHPDPLKCPKGRYRRSIAAYYYTHGRPESETSEVHDTLFQPRPSERLRHRVRRACSMLLPPAMTLGAKRLRRLATGD
ncbi:MAG: 2OG-Fe(II) oxygenase [Planctomycetota bacterium]